MSWDRIERQQAILREKIAMLVLDRLNDPRVGFVTITRAKLSRDRRYCKVFYTVLGSDADRRKTGRALANAAPRVQELLAPVLTTRLIPELQFVYDDTIERESHLLTLIEGLEISSDEDEDESGGESDAAGLDADEGDDADDDDDGDDASADADLAAGDAAVLDAPEDGIEDLDQARGPGAPPA